MLTHLYVDNVVEEIQLDILLVDETVQIFESRVMGELLHDVVQQTDELVPRDLRVLHNKKSCHENKGQNGDKGMDLWRLTG